MIRQISFLPVCPLCLIINDEITKYHIYLSLTHQDITTLTKMTKYYDKLFQKFNVLVENVYLKKIMLYLDEESHAIYTFVILTQSQYYKAEQIIILAIVLVTRHGVFISQDCIIMRRFTINMPYTKKMIYFENMAWMTA